LQILHLLRRQDLNCAIIAANSDLPPLKWSSLKYGFSMEDRINGKEEAYNAA
jgi:hypothetical protein